MPASPTASSNDRPPLLLPRGLIFVASVWLIASWLLAIGVRAPVQPSSASYTPGVRLMLLYVTIGLLIGWPLLRLSQRRPAYPLRQTLLDVIALLCLIQVVVWPSRIVTIWTVQRTAAIDATLGGWLMIAGAIVAAALVTSHAGPRILGMLACVGLCVLGPTLAYIGLMTGVDAMQLVELSPLMAVRTLGEGGGSHPSDVQWRWIVLLWCAAIAVWVALGLSISLSAVRTKSDAQGD